MDYEIGCCVAKYSSRKNSWRAACSGWNLGGGELQGACRSRSRAEFTARLGVVEEEADESGYWLEMIIEGKLMKAKLVESLLTEANELVAIMTSSRITIHRKLLVDKQNATRSIKSQIKNVKSKI